MARPSGLSGSASCARTTTGGPPSLAARPAIRPARGVFACTIWLPWRRAARISATAPAGSRASAAGVWTGCRRRLASNGGTVKRCTPAASRASARGPGAGQAAATEWSARSPSMRRNSAHSAPLAAAVWLTNRMRTKPARDYGSAPIGAPDHDRTRCGAGSPEFFYPGPGAFSGSLDRRRPRAGTAQRRVAVLGAAAPGPDHRRRHAALRRAPRRRSSSCPSDTYESTSKLLFRQGIGPELNALGLNPNTVDAENLSGSNVELVDSRRTAVATSEALARRGWDISPEDVDEDVAVAGTRQASDVVHITAEASTRGPGGAVGQHLRAGRPRPRPGRRSPPDRGRGAQRQGSAAPARASARPSGARAHGRGDARRRRLPRPRAQGRRPAARQHGAPADAGRGGHRQPEGDPARIRAQRARAEARWRRSSSGCSSACCSARASRCCASRPTAGCTGPRRCPPPSTRPCWPPCPATARSSGTCPSPTFRPRWPRPSGCST